MSGDIWKFCLDTAEKKLRASSNSHRHFDCVTSRFSLLWCENTIIDLRKCFFMDSELEFYYLLDVFLLVVLLCCKDRGWSSSYERLGISTLHMQIFCLFCFCLDMYVLVFFFSLCNTGSI